MVKSEAKPYSTSIQAREEEVLGECRGHVHSRCHVPSRPLICSSTYLSHMTRLQPVKIVHSRSPSHPSVFPATVHSFSPSPPPPPPADHCGHYHYHPFHFISIYLLPSFLPLHSPSFCLPIHLSVLCLPAVILHSTLHLPPHLSTCQFVNCPALE